MKILKLFQMSVSQYFFLVFIFLTHSNLAYTKETISTNETLSVSAGKLFSFTKCMNSEITEQSLKVPNYLLKTEKKLSEGTADILQIQLIPGELQCNETESAIILLNGSESFLQPKLLSNGYIKFHNHSYFSPEEFCVKSTTKTSLEITTCKPTTVQKCSQEFPCIRKCCDLDEVIDLTQYLEEGKIVCVQSLKQWTPQLYKDRNTKVDKSPKIKYIPQHPKSFCDNSVTLMSLRSMPSQEILPFRILQDGSILEKLYRTKWTSVNNLETCVDGAQNFSLNEDDTTFSGPFSGNEEDTVLIDCRSSLFVDDDKTDDTGLYVIALSIAIIFLVLTLIAHIILWKKQTIRGWTLLGYVTFLALEFGFLIVARLTTEHGLTCTFAAIGTHFTALATFSWLTTTNVDVWWSFRTMSPCVSKREQFKIFLIYATFATLVPVSIVMVGLILENTYGGDPFSEVIVPQYGQSKCGLTASAEWSYLFGPISFLLGCNLIFLSVTLYYIYKHQKVLNSNGIKKIILKDKLQFFGMLFLVAGVTWIFDVISWATTPSNEATPWYWMLFDFVNIFQAIAIFLIFVCNRKTLHNLQKEVPWLNYFNFWSSDTKLPTIVTVRNGNEREDDARKMSITQVFSITDHEKNIELK